MQKKILLLPFVCLIFCAGQDSLEIQSLIYTHTPNVDFVQRVSTYSSYLCPDNYVYLVRDFQLFNGVICVDTIITETQLQQGDCSPGWATISSNEVNANPEVYCNMLGSVDVARTGFMGSLSRNNCFLSDFDTLSRITQTICVKREIKDIKLVASKDNICGEGMVLVTLQEAQANHEAYCNLLGGNDVVRLADGGSMDGPMLSGGIGCRIRYEDRRDLSAALCRALQNICLVSCAAQEPLDMQSLLFTHTPNVDVVQRVSIYTKYLCPDDYVYLVLDFQVFNGVVCVETIITDIQLQKGDCSPGWAPVSISEVSANTQQYCNRLGSVNVARIGFMGSLSRDNCFVTDFDTRSTITQTICVKRDIKDIKLVASKDNICGEGMVLVTQQEAQANQDSYWNLLGDYDVVRLADSGSMDGRLKSGGIGCRIRYEDRRDLGAALCRALQNSEPNENEDMFTPETTFNLEQPFDFQRGWI